MKEIDRLKEIVETLRSENGCPWDRAQTHSSLKPACIEEAAEVISGNYHAVIRSTLTDGSLTYGELITAW